MMRKWIRIFVAAALFPLPALADVVAFDNGDRLTGTVAGVTGDTLVLQSEVAGEVALPLGKISEVRTDSPVVFSLRDGRTLTGTATYSGGSWHVRAAAGATETLPVGDVEVARSEPAQRAFEAEQRRTERPSFSQAWAGSVDAGLSTSRGNAQVFTVTSGFRAARTTRHDRLSGYATLLFSENDTIGVTVRTANAIRGGVRYDRNFREQFFGFGFTDLEFDEFRQLDLRTVLGGGLGWNAVDDPTVRFAWFGGASFNREDFSTGILRRSGEGLLGEELTLRLNGKMDVTERAVVFANLTSTGEYRANLDASMVTRLGGGFDWHITVSDRYLSNPVAPALRNDFLLTTGIRYSFGEPPKAVFKARVGGIMK